MSVGALQYSALCETDPHVYGQYLASFRALVFRDVYCNGKSDSLLAEGAGVYDRIVGGYGCTEAGGWGELRNAIGRLMDASSSGAGGHRDSELGSGACESQRVDALAGAASGGSDGCGIAGMSSVAGRSADDGVGDTRRVLCDDAVVTGAVRSDGGVSGEVAVNQGKNWRKNLLKREKRKRMKKDWRSVAAEGQAFGSGTASSGASVVTVDTCAAAGIEAARTSRVCCAVDNADARTAVEIEAVQTLAARRVVENKLAIAKGQVQLRSFGDRAKTDALNRLAAARMEQRINEAKAKSQASYKKCDESLKSLGSTGSAGEFAMRCEVQRARESVRMMKYVQEQADILAKHATPEVLALCAAVPTPEPVDAFELFGECSSDLSEHEAEAYYDELRRLNEESVERFANYF